MTRSINRAWAVAGVAFLVLIAAAAFRSSVGLLIVPFEEEFGWSRSAISLAISVNLVFYGVTAPFAAALMERFGIRQIAVLALGLIAVGTGLTLVMNAAWQLAILWGLFVGVGTGSTALVFGALIANRWFVRNRGLVLGILGAAWATGSLIFLPLLSQTITNLGWRYASLGISV
ncbi:MAG: MFS transporter, partial [Acidobacteria bacterium]|nr:MFS transporter [Acidobacteriota bacterium]